jgi:hypothetical protein
MPAVLIVAVEVMKIKRTDAENRSLQFGVALLMSPIEHLPLSQKRMLNIKKPLRRLIIP